MALHKEEKTEARSRHEWQGSWSMDDYKRHETELREIHRSYEKARAEYDDQPPEKRKVHTDFIFQRLNGGMDKHYSVTYEENELEFGVLLQYDINVFKLEKYKRWVQFSYTPEQRAEGRNRADTIMKIINGQLKIKPR